MLIATAVLASGLALTAWAKKPDKPPGGGGGETLTGTIYFYLDSQIYSMNPDGEDKTPLGIYWNDSFTRNTMPSSELYGEHRWFLQWRIVDGAYPDGYPTRCELFAVRDDGNVIVQLTDDPDLDHRRQDIVWAVDAWNSDGPKVDGLVSFIAQRWEGNVVVEAGIYAAAIEFHENGNVKDQLLAPELLVEGGVIPTPHPGPLGFWFDPDISTFDWAPDGTRIVYDAWDYDPDIDEMNLRGLFIANLQTGLMDQLLVPDGRFPYDPYWSPDGTKIAFMSQNNINTINIDGMDRQIIVEYDVSKWLGGLGGVWVSGWSPTGSHLLYTSSIYKGFRLTTDVYRVRADGEGAKNLTRHTDASCRGIAWR